MFDGPDPVFKQIADYFRTEILAGRLCDHDQLPSTAQFAAAHKINPGTVTKAIGVLVAEGLVIRQRGVGMFVNDGAAAALQKQQRSLFFSQSLEPVLHQASILGISADTVVAHTRQWFQNHDDTAHPS